MEQSTCPCTNVPHVFCCSKRNLEKNKVDGEYTTLQSNEDIRNNDIFSIHDWVIFHGLKKRCDL